MNTEEVFESFYSRIRGYSNTSDATVKYLSQPAPNIIEWVTGLNYWNVPSTFEHVRQYQILRDVFMLRCPICNSTRLSDIDCWGKSRMQLESEVLLTWKAEYGEFVCPKCGTTQYELINDGFFPKYNEMIVLAGMRSGKSFLGAHVGGYFEHMLITWGMQGKGSIQRFLRQEKSEWFEVTFAASTATQAQQTIYAKYREMRGNSPWLNKYVQWVTEAEKHQSSVGKDKWKYKSNDDAILDGWLQVRFNRIASDSAGVAGKTRIMASIDEWARLINSDSTRSALELYRVMNQSLKTVRASVSLNHLPPFLGLMINVTSPVAQDDPAMVTYNAARDGVLKQCYGWKGATWEFNPFMPRSEFDEEYRKDPVGAERDFGSNPPLAATPYIDDPQRLWNCIDWDQRPLVQYAYEQRTDPTGMKYVSAMVEDCRVDPIHNYYVFADAGVRWDAFSLVIARPEYVASTVLGDEAFSGGTVRSAILEAHDRDIPSGMIAIPQKDLIPMGGSMADAQQVYVDWERQRIENRSGKVKGAVDARFGEMLVTKIVSAFRIVPTIDREIWFESILDIMNTLRQRLKIVSFGCDNWNSVSTIQSIRNMGIPATEVTLRMDDFMEFKNLAYNRRISMLPPASTDKVDLLSNGTLTIGVPQVNLSGEGVALVELLKLSRSEDLKRVFNERKGNVRGQDSDDVARCVIGVNKLLQSSVVDPKAANNTNNQILQRLQSLDSPMSGSIYRSSREY